LPSRFNSRPQTIHINLSSAFQIVFHVCRSQVETFHFVHFIPLGQKEFRVDTSRCSDWAFAWKKHEQPHGARGDDDKAARNGKARSRIANTPGGC
jgi:hypothetical protein